MRIGILFLLMIFFVTVSGQQTTEWLNELRNPENPKYELQDENVKADYLIYDFSTLLIPRQDFLGYISSDFRRIKIYFTSVCREDDKEDVYKIKGMSVVGGNKCDFNGTIKIDQVREYKAMHYGLDDEYEDKGLVSQGLMAGSYQFMEDPEQYHSGIFQGIMTLYWYVDRFGILHYDDIEWYSDSYRNNQYVGTWTGYDSDIIKVCNWGEHRIPFSGDLDIGAGGFSPNPKYFDKGWEGY